jgi:hypothetical protein
MLEFQIGYNMTLYKLMLWVMDSCFEAKREEKIIQVRGRDTAGNKVDYFWQENKDNYYILTRIEYPEGKKYEDCKSNESRCLDK